MNMQELPKPIEGSPKPPDISSDQATIDSLAKEIISLRIDLKNQEKENNGFIRWIIAGFLAIVVVVAIEIIIFHTREDKGYADLQNQYFKEVKDVREKSFESEIRLQKEIDELRSREVIKRANSQQSLENQLK